ncbi:MAG: NHL repeat-containing protein [Verrucomicrobia bacterium]|nr:NHL repeat-containing protein [Verrucomicrobiota bacterium]
MSRIPATTASKSSTPEGHWLRSYGRAGTGPGELSYPYDIRVDAEGNQFVCEFGNSRIQVFNAADQPVEIIGRAGAAPGQFSNPWSLALDSRGNLYVADSGNHRVQKLVRRTPCALHTPPPLPPSTAPDSPPPAPAPVAPSHRPTVAPSHRRTVAPSHRPTVPPSHRPTP